MRKKWIVVALGLMGIGAMLVAFTGPGQNAYKNIQKLQYVLSIVSQVYVEDVDSVFKKAVAQGAKVKQELIMSPSISTVQAPHTPTLQPSLVPVRPIS